MPISRAEFENAYPVLFHVSLARDVAQIRIACLQQVAIPVEIFTITPDGETGIPSRKL